MVVVIGLLLGQQLVTFKEMKRLVMDIWHLQYTRRKLKQFTLMQRKTQQTGSPVMLFACIYWRSQISP